MPENFHLSISKLISDHFEMATAQVCFQIKVIRVSKRYKTQLRNWLIRIDLLWSKVGDLLLNYACELGNIISFCDAFDFILCIWTILLVHGHLFENHKKIDYGIDYFHVMETTRLLGAPQLAHQPHQWPVWHQARTQVLITVSPWKILDFRLEWRRT